VTLLLVKMLEKCEITEKFTHKLSSASYEFTRLDTSNASQKNSLTNTQRKLHRQKKEVVIRWEWMEDNGSYKPYEEKQSETIENAELEKPVIIGNYSIYKMNQNTGTQTNISTQKVRQIRRQVAK